MIDSLSSMIADPARLAALTRLNLLDTPADPSFDRLTALAARMIHAPVSLVSLVDTERQFFKSQVGLSEPWASRRQTPLSHAFCRHVVERNEPLIVSDARYHPLVFDNPAISDLGIVAYAGMPLRTSDGCTIGALCVIDHEPRVWTEQELGLLSELAELTAREIELRDQYEQRHRAETELYAVSQAKLREAEILVERVRNLEQMKTEMIRVVAHDLRNPLGLVMGYSELMLEEGDSLSEHHREFMQSIHRSGKKMLMLINDLLSLERLTASQEENFQPIALDELAREVYEANCESARVAAHDYRYESDGSAYCTMGDMAQLREAMENLISNAIKYTPPGGRITVRLKGRGDHVLFQVEDTGYGIPKEEQGRLFQAFFRSLAEETYAIGGTGLGLHLVKSIVERHHGEVVFESEYSKGSTFGLVLPRALTC